MCCFKEGFVPKQTLFPPGFLLQRWHICHILTFLHFLTSLGFPQVLDRLSPSSGHWNSTLKFKNVKRINRTQSCRLPECRLLPFLPLKVNCIGNVIFLWASKLVASAGFILQYRQILKLFLDIKKGFVALVPQCWFPQPGARPPEHHLEWEGDFASAGHGWGVLKHGLAPWSDWTRAGCAMLSQSLACGSSSLCKPALSAGCSQSGEPGDLGATCCSGRSVCETLPNPVCACLSTRGASPCPGSLNKITGGKREPAIPPDSSGWGSSGKVWFVVCEKCLHLTAFHRKPVRVII